MFKIAVNNLVQSIGDDVYLPSPSTAASKNLAPLSLVERKRRVLPLKRMKDYYTTDFSLDDIVEGKQCKVDMESDERFCTFNRESTVKVEGMLKGYIKGIFDAGVRRVDSVAIKTELGELCIVEVDQQSLLTDLNGRKLDMEHELVKELAASKRRALCIVTGVVKTTTDATISAKLGQEFNAEAEAIFNPMSLSKKVVGGKIKGTHEKDSSRVLNLPAGTVLAYQVHELAINSDGTARVMVMHGSTGGFNVKTPEG